MRATDDIADWLFAHEGKPLDLKAQEKLLLVTYTIIDHRYASRDTALMKQILAILNGTEGEAE